MGDHETSYLTTRRVVIREYALCSVWPDQAAFFADAGDGAAYLAREGEIRPHVLTQPWRVIRLADMGEELGFFDNTARSMLGGREPEHPQPKSPAADMAP